MQAKPEATRARRVTEIAEGAARGERANRWWGVSNLIAASATSPRVGSLTGPACCTLAPWMVESRRAR
ncbi:hypothetical protein GCM10027259_12960 [Micromonospora palomenae]